MAQQDATVSDLQAEELLAQAARAGYVLAHAPESVSELPPPPPMPKSSAAKQDSFEQVKIGTPTLPHPLHIQYSGLKPEPQYVGNRPALVADRIRQDAARLTNPLTRSVVVFDSLALDHQADAQQPQPQSPTAASAAATDARPPNVEFKVNVHQSVSNESLAASSSGVSSAARSADLKPYYTPQDAHDTTLVFESRFEGGNLLQAIQVGPFEYDLITRPDYNTRDFAQWYYFSVDNTRAFTEYRFNIINMIKADSMYNYGMRPTVYSEALARREGIGWHHAGENVCYYQNHRKRSSKQHFYTCSFSIVFKYHKDKVYFAYSYPYTYTMLQNDLRSIVTDPQRRPFVRRRALCRTLMGNVCHLLTITDFSASYEAMTQRKGVVITARVHPGETPASWIVRSIMYFLTGDSMVAKKLRRKCVFKIVPMLNPDGVIHGNYRCSLAGVDLNRQWRVPSKELHPTIYHTKTLIRRMTEDRHVMLYTDLHGHSRRNNIFAYGCEEPKDRTMWARVFPRMLYADGSNVFSYEDSNFVVQRSKLGTARVVMNREMGIANSFTIESSFSGANFGEAKGLHFTVDHFTRFGHVFCRAILGLLDPVQCELTADQLRVLFARRYGSTADDLEDTEDDKKKKSRKGRRGSRKSAQDRKVRAILNAAVAKHKALDKRRSGASTSNEWDLGYKDASKGSSGQRGSSSRAPRASNGTSTGSDANSTTRRSNRGSGLKSRSSSTPSMLAQRRRNKSKVLAEARNELDKQKGRSAQQQQQQQPQPPASSSSSTKRKTSDAKSKTRRRTSKASSRASGHSSSSSTPLRHTASTPAFMRQKARKKDQEADRAALQAEEAEALRLAAQDMSSSDESSPDVSPRAAGSPVKQQMREFVNELRSQELRRTAADNSSSSSTTGRVSAPRRSRRPSQGAKARVGFLSSMSRGTDSDQASTNSRARQSKSKAKTRVAGAPSNSRREQTQKGRKGNKAGVPARVQRQPTPPGASTPSEQQPPLEPQQEPTQSPSGPTPAARPWSPQPQRERSRTGSTGGDVMVNSATVFNVISRVGAMPPHTTSSSESDRGGVGLDRRRPQSSSVHRFVGSTARATRAVHPSGDVPSPAFDQSSVRRPRSSLQRRSTATTNDDKQQGRALDSAAREDVGRFLRGDSVDSGDDVHSRARSSLLPATRSGSGRRALGHPLVAPFQETPRSPRRGSAQGAIPAHVMDLSSTHVSDKPLPWATSGAPLANVADEETEETSSPASEEADALQPRFLRRVKDVDTEDEEEELRDVEEEEVVHERQPLRRGDALDDEHRNARYTSEDEPSERINTQYLAPHIPQVQVNRRQNNEASHDNYDLGDARTQSDNVDDDDGDDSAGDDSESSFAGADEVSERVQDTQPRQAVVSPTRGVLPHPVAPFLGADATRVASASAVSSRLRTVEPQRPASRPVSTGMGLYQRTASARKNALLARLRRELLGKARKASLHGSGKAIVGTSASPHMVTSSHAPAGRRAASSHSNTRQLRSRSSGATRKKPTSGSSSNGSAARGRVVSAAHSRPDTQPMYRSSSGLAFVRTARTDANIFVRAGMTVSTGLGSSSSAQSYSATNSSSNDNNNNNSTGAVNDSTGASGANNPLVTRGALLRGRRGSSRRMRDVTTDDTLTKDSVHRSASMPSSAVGSSAHDFAVSAETTTFKHLPRGSSHSGYSSAVNAMGFYSYANNSTQAGPSASVSVPSGLMVDTMGGGMWEVAGAMNSVPTPPSWATLAHSSGAEVPIPPNAPATRTKTSKGSRRSRGKSSRSKASGKGKGTRSSASKGISAFGPSDRDPYVAAKGSGASKRRSRKKSKSSSKGKRRPRSAVDSVSSHVVSAALPVRLPARGKANGGFPIRKSLSTVVDHGSQGSVGFGASAPSAKPRKKKTSRNKSRRRSRNAN